jgi:hypothetical protein
MSTLKGKAREKILIAFLKGVETPGYKVVENSNGEFRVFAEEVKLETTAPEVGPIETCNNSKIDFETNLQEFAKKLEIEEKPPAKSKWATRKKFSLL